MNAKCIKSKLTRAFSLIELMVVIAIIGLLTAVGLPAYQQYLSQSKVAEIFALASDQMNQWNGYYTLGGTFNKPTACTALGNYISCAELLDVSTAATLTGLSSVCPTGGYANGLGTALGVVCIKLNASTGIDNSLNGLVLYFTPYTPTNMSASGDTTDTGIAWACNFVTSSVGAGGTAATATTLLKPGNCTAH